MQPTQTYVIESSIFPPSPPVRFISGLTGTAGLPQSGTSSLHEDSRNRHLSAEEEHHEGSRLQRTRDVSVKNVPDARIEQPNDVIVKITTNICGSDLHMYEGRTDFKPGGVFGQVALQFLVRCPGLFTIPKASTPEHAAQNAGAGDFQLSAADIARIDKAFPLGPRPVRLPML
jgi:hypothetical protein